MDDLSGATHVRVKMIVARHPACGDSTWSTFVVHVDQGSSVLNALCLARDWNDPSLAFNGTCERGVCDGCWVMLNGENVLACTTPVDREMRIAPIPERRVLRDLFVDLADPQEEV